MLKLCDYCNVIIHFIISLFILKDILHKFNNLLFKFKVQKLNNKIIKLRQEIFIFGCRYYRLTLIC